jgi:hypothetical protein
MNNTNTDSSAGSARSHLRAEIAKKRLERLNKHAKEQVLDRTMKKFGIDKEKFKQDLDAVTKAGGFKVELE